MQQEDVFPKLVDLIQEWQFEPPVHRLLLVLMYEMVRIVPLTWNDLGTLKHRIHYCNPNKC
jgi:hypothetical protein